MKSYASRSPYKAVFGVIAIAVILISGAVGVMFIQSNQTTDNSSQASGVRKPEFRVRPLVTTTEGSQIVSVILDGSNMKNSEVASNFRVTLRLAEGTPANQLGQAQPLASYLNARQPIYNQGDYKVYPGGNVVEITKVQVVEAENGME